MMNEDISGMEFEQAMKELEDVVSKLEGGKVSLKDSVNMYERGVALKKHCEKLLESARLTIKQITSDEDGELKVEDFSDA